MNAKQLKDSILQYAMQGKLVSQNPNDEPASKLLQRITNEKERLIKEGIIKKEKPVSPIVEEEILYDIPSSWEWVRLKNLGYITSGGTPKTSEQSFWTNGDIVWITPSDMGKNKSKFLSNSSRKITLEGLNNSSAQLIPKNSIVYSSRAPIGHINIMECDYATNQGCKSVTPLLIDLAFLYYALIYMTPEIQKKASGTTFKEISGTVFSETLIPLPPLNEQVQIVKKIEQLLLKVEEYEVAYSNVTKLNNEFPMDLEKSILQYAMQGKLAEQDINDEPAQGLIEKIQLEKERLVKEKVIKKEKPLPPITEEEIPFDIPSSWEWVRLGDISTKIHYGYTASAAVKGNVRLLRITDIQNNSVNWEDVPYCSIDENKLESMLLKERDILIARTGGTIGKSFLIKEVTECSVFASYLIRVQLLSQISEDFISYYLRSPLYWNQLIEMSAGTGQPNVNAQNLKLLLVPIPPLEEQYKIVTAIEQMLFVKNKLSGLD